MSGASTLLAADIEVGHHKTAEILGCSEGTVKSQTTHGLNALRKILGEPRSVQRSGGAR